MVNVDTKLTHITTDGSNSGSLGQQMFDMSAQSLKIKQINY